jgi:hypothetical protein
MKETDWPKCFNYDHKDPFPESHNCSICRRCGRMPAGVITPGDWCTQYHYTDKPKCTANCAGMKHKDGCEIERWASYNYVSGRYDDSPDPRLTYEAAIQIGCPKFVPKKNIKRRRRRIGAERVWKDHADGKSCRYGCIPATAPKCKNCNLECSERKAHYDPTAKLTEVKVRRAHSVRSRRFKVLRGKILRPAFKISMMEVHKSIMAVRSRDLCKGCVSETGPFDGTLCKECQVVVHTRPTNFKNIKKVKK